MKTFILVLMLHDIYDGGVSIDHIPGFNSLSECKIAVDIVTQTFYRSKMVAAQATCVEQTRPQ